MLSLVSNNNITFFFLQVGRLCESMDNINVHSAIKELVTFGIANNFFYICKTCKYLFCVL